MKTLNNIISALIFLTFVILVGIGHGIVPLGLIELFLIPSLFSSETFHSGSNEVIYMIFILFALIGHILLAFGLRIKKAKPKIYLVMIGQLLLLGTISFLTKDFLVTNDARFTLVLSVPALLTMVVLTFYLFRRKEKWMASRG